MGKPSSSFQYRRMVAVPLIAGNSGLGLGEVAESEAKSKYKT
jgi:hypothetical protein